MGYSATAFAKNRRKGRLAASKAGRRALKELAPVAHMFQDRFCRGSGQIDWTLEDVQKIVSRSEWKEDELEENLIELTLNRTSKQVHKADTSSSSSSSSKLPATKLLRRLRNALQGEVLELSMDYLGLHRFCWMYLSHANKVLKSDLRVMYGRRYIQTESQLPFIAGYVFMAATAAKDAGNLLMPAVAPHSATSHPLIKAAGAMRGFLDGGAGDLMCRVLQTRYNIVVADAGGSDDNDDDEREASGDVVS